MVDWKEIVSASPDRALKHTSGGKSTNKWFYNHSHRRAISQLVVVGVQLS